MPLFEVPDWNVPSSVQSSTQSAKPSRKRKRSTHEEDMRLGTAAFNFEKLVKQLEEGGSTSSKEKKKARSEGLKSEKKVESVSSKVDQRPGGKKERKGKGKPKEKPLKTSEDDTVMPPKKKRQKENKSEQTPVVAEDKPNLQNLPKKSKPFKESDLTPLQSKMKATLDGARFRHINEVMYKSKSTDVQKLIKKDPQLFEEYHTGFRHQVQSWPTNPISVFTKQLQMLPKGTVIADLGCGDAALAKALVPKGICVLSYDLQSDEAYIVATDICSRLPLPGAADGSTGQIVDVVVCSLSLMSTNWLGCIREAWRVLKPGGILKIAEVTSRIGDISAFISAIDAFGFRLDSKDDRNTHFLLFEFTKAKNYQIATGDKLEKLLAAGDVLKPCEYKRR